MHGKPIVLDTLLLYTYASLIRGQ